MLAKAHGPETAQPVLQRLMGAPVPVASSIPILGLAMNHVDPKLKLQHQDTVVPEQNYSGSQDFLRSNFLFLIFFQKGE